MDGEPAGERVIGLEDAEENRHRIDVEWLAVVPTRRRQGVGDALLRACFAHEALVGRGSITFWAPTLTDGAGVAYAKRCGATMRMEERCSRLRIADVPDDLVGGWLDEGRARTDGYRVVQWVGPIPDEHLSHMVEAHRAMEDMPDAGHQRGDGLPAAHGLPGLAGRRRPGEVGGGSLI